jgi:hypothetical protein
MSPDDHAATDSVARRRAMLTTQRAHAEAAADRLRDVPSAARTYQTRIDQIDRDLAALNSPTAASFPTSSD